MMKTQEDIDLLNILGNDKSEAASDITTGTDNTTKKVPQKICIDISADKKQKIDVGKIHQKLLLLLEKDYECKVYNEKQCKLDLNVYSKTSTWILEKFHTFHWLQKH